MDKPTKAQIKELWEWCGLKWFWNHNPECHCGEVDDDGERSWHYKDGDEWKLATQFWGDEMVIDLNNLFKYAVPKLLDDGVGVDLVSYRHKGVGYYSAKICPIWKGWTANQAELSTYKDPALALFWAIYEAIK